MQIPIIPIFTEFTDQQKIIIESAGINLAKQAIFKGVMPTSNVQPDDNYNRVVYSTAFGLPIFDPLNFFGFTWTDVNGINQEVFGGLGAFVIETALIEVKQNRNIITTSIMGRNGTVKEYISDNDYQIKIKGLLSSNAQNIYPQEQMNTLREFCTAIATIPVQSNVLDYFGIRNIVIMDYEFIQLEGDRSNVPFEITALSDIPYDIQLKFN